MVNNDNSSWNIENTEKIIPNADCIFEVSWEVCNKVGGIYTVIKSKAERMMENYKNYFLIGPYFEHNARVDFKEMTPPMEFQEIFLELKSEGIFCRYGIWDELKGKPFTILIDFNGFVSQKDSIKGILWNQYGIDSLRGYWDFEEPMLWSYAVGKLIEKIYKKLFSGKKVVGQFHEWLSAFGIFYLKKNCKEVATVFTTHATMLGRTLCGSGVDIYHNMKNIDCMREAYYHNIEAKHLTEKAAALNCDAFTTVSAITGIEAEIFFGRKPDVLVLNGLDMARFPSFEDTSIKHITSRDKIREFLTYYFFPYYTFDINHNLIFYTVGRFEYHNKGYDIIIQAMGRLNQLLKAEKQNNVNFDGRTVSMIFWLPMGHNGIRLDVLENKNYYRHIKNLLTANSPEIITNMLYDFISNKKIDEGLFNDSFINQIKKDVIAFEKKGNPPLSTHNISDENNNPIMCALKNNGLLNRKEDMVKIIIEPVYLDGTDGFIDLNYYDTMSGCHLGLFPSYYEPWGYTPLESAALGVPALTSDLSGFGMFIKDKISLNSGLYVLDRLGKNDDEIINNFAKILFDFSMLDHAQRVERKLNAKKTAALADWKFLINNYIEAHNIAILNNDAKNNAIVNKI